MDDTYKHKGLRKKLAAEIAARGISDDQVLNAIASVPRHLFMDTAFLAFAYQDKAFPIDAGQTISQPFTVAYQSELLQVEKGDKVLEIGTGSGYQTSVLIEMGAKVYTIERQKTLYDKARHFLPSLGYNPKMFYGDGYKGLPSFAPFDKVIVTAGAPFIPEDLTKQLRVGGIMVIPVGNDKGQVMTTIIRTSENSFEKTELENFRFVPLLGDKAW